MSKPQQSQEPRLITTAEFARRAGRSKRWGIIAVDQGHVPSVRVGPYRLILEDVAAKYAASPPVVSRPDVFRRYQAGGARDLRRKA